MSRPGSPTPTTTTLRVVGKTYPLRDQLRALGAEFVGGERAWFVPASLREDVEALGLSVVESAPPRPESLLVGGRGTYDVRLDLAALGGRWQSAITSWVLPISARAEVERLVQGRDVTLREAVVIAPRRPAPQPRAERPAPAQPPGPAGERLTALEAERQDIRARSHALRDQIAELKRSGRAEEARRLQAVRDPLIKRLIAISEESKALREGPAVGESAQPARPAALPEQAPSKREEASTEAPPPAASTEPAEPAEEQLPGRDASDHPTAAPPAAPTATQQASEAPTATPAPPLALSSELGREVDAEVVPISAEHAADLEEYRELATVARTEDELARLDALDKKYGGDITDPRDTTGRSVSGLLPPSVRAQLPPIGAQERLGADAVAHAKFFLGAWTWYATEFDGKDQLFGLVDGHEKELGYFSLSELESLRGPFDLPVERDLYWTPAPLRKIAPGMFRDAAFTTPSPVEPPVVTPPAAEIEAPADSPYAGEDLAALVEAARQEQSGRLLDLAALEAALSALEAGSARESQVRAERDRLRSRVDAGYEEVSRAAGPAAAEALRLELEAGSQADEFDPDLLAEQPTAVEAEAVPAAEIEAPAAVESGAVEPAMARLIELIGGAIEQDQARLAMGHGPSPDWGETRHLLALAASAYGGTLAEGKFTIKDAYDALEAGVNIYIERRVREYEAAGSTPEDTLQLLQRVQDRLPTQTLRTHEQQLHQQFSTPPTLAYAAVRAAGIRPGDVVLEPSAGVGGLAVLARAEGATVVTNEIAPRRLALLRHQGFAATEVDAEYLHDLLPDEAVKPTVVVMNPPFSANGGRTGNDTSIGMSHVLQALQRLEPGGRLVAITGQTMTFGAPEGPSRAREASGAASRDWWLRVMDRYTVRANLAMPGSVYGKYGTSYGTQLLVIDKTGPTPGSTWAERLDGIAWGKAESVVDALQRVEQLRGSRAAEPEQVLPAAAAAPEVDEPAASTVEAPSRASLALGIPYPAGRAEAGRGPSRALVRELLAPTRWLERGLDGHWLTATVDGQAAHGSGGFWALGAPPETRTVKQQPDRPLESLPAELSDHASRPGPSVTVAALSLDERRREIAWMSNGLPVDARQLDYVRHLHRGATWHLENDGLQARNEQGAWVGFVPALDLPPAPPAGVREVLGDGLPPQRDEIDSAVLFVTRGLETDVARTREALRMALSDVLAANRLKGGQEPLLVDDGVARVRPVKVAIDSQDLKLWVNTPRSAAPTLSASALVDRVVRLRDLAVVKSSREPAVPSVEVEQETAPARAKREKPKAAPKPEIDAEALKEGVAFPADGLSGLGSLQRSEVRGLLSGPRVGGSWLTGELSDGRAWHSNGAFLLLAPVPELRYSGQKDDRENAVSAERVEGVLNSAVQAPLQVVHPVALSKIPDGPELTWLSDGIPYESRMLRYVARMVPGATFVRGAQPGAPLAVRAESGEYVAVINHWQTPAPPAGVERLLAAARQEALPATPRALRALLAPAPPQALSDQALAAWVRTRLSEAAERHPGLLTAGAELEPGLVVSARLDPALRLKVNDGASLREPALLEMARSTFSIQLPVPTTGVEAEVEAAAEPDIEEALEGLAEDPETELALEEEQPVEIVEPAPERPRVPLQEREIVAVPRPRAAALVRANDDAVFVDYAPVRLDTTGLRAHPGRLVETASMAAVEPPAITYASSLPASLLEEGRLSDVQYEAILYAGQAHAQRMSDGQRKAFFTGAGTGVGKGRVLSGVIIDNWMQGRQRALWVSVSNDLIEATRRDLHDLDAGDEIPLARLNDFGPHESIDQERGVIFCTYATLIQKSKKSGQTRVDQLKAWLGDDGVMIFDEAHKAKNAIPTGRGEATQTAQAVLKLQELLPGARVVYSSATGATDVRNMAYMSRLGLWGPGTSFSGGFPEFMSEIDAGGVGAMEMVARDLKALGLYWAPSISFQGVEYREAVHTLTPEQRKLYDTACAAWQVVLADVNKALGDTGADRTAKRNAITAFWGAEQRFFKQVLTAMKVPTVIGETQAALDRGQSVVIGLIGTGEARTEGKVNKALAEGMELDDLDFTPREILAQFVDRAFPTELYQEVYNEETGETSVRKVLDANGNPVESKEALAAKQSLLEKLSGGLVLPENPLDQLVNHFGVDQVAELTGRHRRLVRDPGTGRVEYVKRAPDGVAMARVNLWEMEQFQSGVKRIAVISQAASTGISLHASNRDPNQQRRCHITAELGWSADQQLQTFGRTHRSDQASAPEYVLVCSDLGGEKRFVSTIARRLESLGALTKGQADASGQGGLIEYNFETDEGKAALTALYQRMSSYGCDIPGLVDPRQVLRDMGILRVDGYKEQIAEEDYDHVPRFLNRLLAIDVARQNAVFDAYARIYEDVVAKARENGTFDRGVTDLHADTVRLAEPPVEVNRDDTTGAATYHYVVEMERKVFPIRFESLASDGKGGFFENTKSGRVVYAEDGPPKTDEISGRVTERKALTTARARHAEYIDRYKFEADYRRLDQADAKTRWAEAVASVPEKTTERAHLIGGAILPLWERLKSTNAQRLHIVRAALADGQRVVGIRVPGKDVARILAAIGIKQSLRSPEEVYRGVLESRERVDLVGGLRVVYSRKYYEDRIELVGADEARYRELRAMGLKEELDNFKNRFFVPTDEVAGIEVLEKLLARYPALAAEPGVAESGKRPPINVVVPLQQGAEPIPAI